jgi:hypothetical protein
MSVDFPWTIYSFISQKMELFIYTTVRASDHTKVIKMLTFLLRCAVAYSALVGKE